MLENSALERRVSVLEQEFAAFKLKSENEHLVWNNLQEELLTLTKENGQKLEGFRLIIKEIGGKVDRLDSKVTNLERRMDEKIDSKIDTLERKMDGKIDRLDTKIDGVAEQLKEALTYLKK